jgi:RNA polymerase sigma factor (sigma-70 family)
MAAIDAPPPAFPPAMLSAMDDDALVDLIAGGSDDAFAALDERYRRRLVRFARGFVAGTPDAEDAVQDAMMRALRALRSGKGRPDAVGPWLHRIARNCALDVTAARRRHPLVELTDQMHPVAEDAHAAVERRLGTDGLVADVGGLPRTQRSALVLRELEGRSYADIADELDTTIPAVKSLLVRARTGLKRARDGRLAAALTIPFPLLQRLAERVGTLWEPVAATATPKVACAAVVVAGSLPILAPATGVTGHRAAEPATATTSVRAAVPKETAPVSASSPSASAAQARSPQPLPRRPVSITPSGATGSTGQTADTGAVTAPASAVPDAALHADCADGVLDGNYTRTMLQQALTGTDGRSATEYSDCAQALQQALLRD